ncbi:uncharacterized protein LOC135947115 [Cloeon dipterum]|uniref:uncharacterized protein LOC135947115 n=1 Tax=Cloeon dipterum TaxID=197152 RepID=UPI00321F76E1
MPASDAFAAMTCNGEAVQTVAAGDRLQLRPRSSSKIAELLDGQYSFFDMLADSDYFQDDGLVPKVGLGVSLTVNYRAHPRLVRGVSALFYHGLMTPARDLIVGDETLRLRHELREVGLDVDANPLYWVDHTSRMERDFLTSSLYNVGEAEVVVRLFKFLTSVIPHRLITVISPYRKQVLLLKEMLPPTVPTYTVDEIIGQERPVVIVSLVCSDLSDSGVQSHGLGFLREPNRVNVMVSRAKELAILVGSRAHFAKSRVGFWETLTTRATGIQPDF